MTRDNHRQLMAPLADNPVLCTCVLLRIQSHCYAGEAHQGEVTAIFR